MSNDKEKNKMPAAEIRFHKNMHEINRIIDEISVYFKEENKKLYSEAERLALRKGCLKEFYAEFGRTPKEFEEM